MHLTPPPTAHPYGILPQTLQSIIDVIASYPCVEQAILYGSRAKGTHRTGSDIDICLMGEQVSLDTQLHMAAQLDDLPTLYTFDLSIYHAIQNPQLLAHIDRVGKVLYKKK